MRSSTSIFRILMRDEIVSDDFFSFFKDEVVGANIPSVEKRWTEQLLL